MKLLRTTALIGLARAAWRHRHRIAGVARKAIGGGDRAAEVRSPAAGGR